MKKQNAAEVYYFILRVIESCINEQQIDNCEVLLDCARFYNYAFTDDLCSELLVKRCGLISERYPVTE